MGLADISSVWPSRTIPFQMSSSFARDPGLAKAARIAIRNWNSISVVQLRPVSEVFLDRRWLNAILRRGADPTRFARIFFMTTSSQRGCNAQVRPFGLNTWKRVRCNANVSSIRILEHEIGHTLGLKHEHQRIDRARSVIINEVVRNSSTPSRGDYLIFSRGVLLGGYDCQSVMHYRESNLVRMPLNAGSIVDRPCTGIGAIARKLDGNRLTTQCSGTDLNSDSCSWISNGDIAAVSTLYRRKPLL